MREIPTPAEVRAIKERRHLADAYRVRKEMKANTKDLLKKIKRALEAGVTRASSNGCYTMDRVNRKEIEDHLKPYGWRCDWHPHLVFIEEL